MQQLKACFILSFTISFIAILNKQWGSIPPIGKFLDPLNGFWQNAEKKPINVAKVLHSPDIKKSITISFDKYLIPHIEAQNDEDLYFAQGYVTAFHRLWQMDFQSRYMAGRLSEVVGRRALKVDRLQRRLGFTYAAEKLLDVIKKCPPLYKIVKAYTAGVNHYIQSLHRYNKFPLEYKLMNNKPELWTIKKTAFTQLALSYNFSGQDMAIKNTYALKLLGNKIFDLVFPEYPKKVKPLYKNNFFSSNKVKLLSPKRLTIPDIGAPQVISIEQGINSASNNWVISGKHTSTKKPFLANDPHASLTLPAINYLVHLKSPQVNVLGSSLPGIPGINIGFNENIAWGITSAMANVKDWYKVKFQDRKKTYYWYDNTLFRARHVKEIFTIKGETKPYIDTVIYTHWGPVPYDENFQEGPIDVPLAVKWIGHRPYKEILAFHKINRARNKKEFDKALEKNYKSPGLNFAFAAVDKTISLQLAGKYPTKFKYQGKFIMPGESPKYRWDGWIPTHHMPNIINPQKGFLSSANENLFDPSFPYYLYSHQYHQFRYKHLRDMLAQLTNTNKRVTTKDMVDLQSNTFNQLASEILPFLLLQIDSNELSKDEYAAHKLLKNWNLCNTFQSKAAPIFVEWKNQIYKLLWKKLLTNKNLPKPRTETTFTLLKEHPQGSYFIFSDYKNSKNLIKAAYTKCINSFYSEKKKMTSFPTWSQFHRITIKHLSRIPSLGTPPIAIDGGKYTLNTTENNQGVVLRMIASLEGYKQAKALMIYPGGQPGNPGNPSYLQFLPLWAEKKYLSLNLEIPQQNQQLALITFKPVKK